VRDIDTQAVGEGTMWGPFEQAEHIAAAKPELSELNLTTFIPLPNNHANGKPVSDPGQTGRIIKTDRNRDNCVPSAPEPGEPSGFSTSLKHDGPAERQTAQQNGSKATLSNQDQKSGNPLFPGADPDVLIADKTYWIYPTGEGNLTDDFLVHSSPDLTHWTTRGPILNLADIGWVNADGQPHHDLWAPGVLQENNKYYLYYAVGAPDWKQSRIGVAVCDTPDGKFKDIGRPLITSGDGFQAIDPMAFTDPKTGDHLLYCGGAGGCKLHVYKLNPDLVSIDKEIPVDTPKNFTEAPYMSYRNGIYYMSYSHGLFFNPDYSVCYSTSNSPTGPWTFKGAILQSNEEHLGPGHHAFLENPSTGKWYIVYHRWNGAGTTGKMPSTRSVAIDNLEYKKNGDILPVKMTDTGVDPTPL
jgi:beta-xylosidase